MIDHVIYAAPDLDRAVADFARDYGVVASTGGRHVGFGTRNALLGLDGDRYLEIMSIDEQQAAPAKGRLLGLDRASTPRWAGWCARAARPLAETQRIARDAGCELGEIIAMSRARADGGTLAWTMTSPYADRESGVLPFYIDWGAMPNPASSMPTALALVSLTVIHPDARRIRSILDALGEGGVLVETGPAPSLRVELRVPESDSIRRAE